MDGINRKELLKARTASQLAEAFHLLDPNVSLIDVGLRIKERDGRRITPHLTVRVHLRKKLRGPAFESFARNHPKRIVDEQMIGYPVDIIEANYPLQFHGVRSSMGSPRVGVHQTLEGGISVSNEWSFSFGTLGGFVEDRNTRERMILSNWHVLAGSVSAPMGLRILQPGFGDGGRRRHTVAHLERHAMDKGIDAAVARLSGMRQHSNSALGIGNIKGSAAPALGIHVTKSGRTTAVTEGVITGIDGVAKIPYGRFERLIRHITHIAKVDGSELVSEAGDSGSWWLEKSSHRVVALHFAGDRDPNTEYGLAVDIEPVLNALNVDVIVGI